MPAQRRSAVAPEEHQRAAGPGDHLQRAGGREPALDHGERVDPADCLRDLGRLPPGEARGVVVPPQVGHAGERGRHDQLEVAGLAEVALHQDRVAGHPAAPADVARGVPAHLEAVGAHQAGHAAGCATVTVAVGGPESSPGATAAATAGGVLVRAAEDVPGLVGEHAVEVVRAPTVVVVGQDEPRAADRAVGEVGQWVLGYERAVGPSRAMELA